MRKAVYLLFLFASFVASGLGLNKSEAQATSSITNDSALTTSDSGKLYFSDLIEGHNGSGLIAAHYSHRATEVMGATEVIKAIIPADTNL